LKFVAKLSDGWVWRALGRVVFADFSEDLFEGFENVLF